MGAFSFLSEIDMSEIDEIKTNILLTLETKMLSSGAPCYYIVRVTNSGNVYLRRSNAEGDLKYYDGWKAFKKMVDSHTSWRIYPSANSQRTRVLPKGFGSTLPPKKA